MQEAVDTWLVVLDI